MGGEASVDQGQLVPVSEWEGRPVLTGGTQSTAEGEGPQSAAPQQHGAGTEGRDGAEGGSDRPIRRSK